LAQAINADPALDLRNDPRVRALELARTFGEERP
jgi:hypothetical protein